MNMCHNIQTNQRTHSNIYSGKTEYNIILSEFEKFHEYEYTHFTLLLTDDYISFDFKDTFIIIEDPRSHGV